MGIEYKYGKAVSMESLNRNIAWRIETNKKMKEKAEKLHFVGKREACPICNSKNKTKYAAFFNVSYMECADCGLLYQYEIPDPESIRAIYENESLYLSHMTDEKYFQKRVEMIAYPKAEYITSHVKKRSGNDEWLDIGCGGCEVLFSAKKLNWKVRGIETGLLGVEQGKKLGIPVEQQFITEENAVQLLKHPYLISLLDVLEHLENPKNILKLITANSDCEYLVLSVPHHPSLSAFASKLFPNDVTRHLIIPDHLFIFSEKSLQLLVSECGFEITHCWKYGQDFYELMSMTTQQAKQDIDSWPKELFSAMNDVQFALDKHGLSDIMLVIAKRKK